MKIQSVKSKLDPISRYVRLSFSTFPPFFSIMRKGPLVSAKGVKTPRGFCVKTVLSAAKEMSQIFSTCFLKTKTDEKHGNYPQDLWEK